MSECDMKVKHCDCLIASYVKERDEAKAELNNERLKNAILRKKIEQLEKELSDEKLRHGLEIRIDTLTGERNAYRDVAKAAVRRDS